jgi:hypothetical protein
MSAPPILALRRAIVAHLKADIALTALLPSARIFGERSTEGSWPFSRIGELEAVPGHEIGGAIHVFSKGDFTDEVAAILERIGTSLDDQVLYLGDEPFEGPKANVTLVRTRIIPDGAEQSAWHGIATISATVPKDCTI